MLKWKDLKLLEKPNILPVPEGSKEPYFSSWQILNNYLTPFTDLVMVDNYIFSDSSLISSNFEQIITQFDNATPVKYNLTIITFEGGKLKLNAKKLYDLIIELKGKNKWKCKVGVVMSTRNVKEHDREFLLIIIELLQEIHLIILLHPAKLLQIQIFRFILLRVLMSCILHMQHYHL